MVHKNIVPNFMLKQPTFLLKLLTFAQCFLNFILFSGKIVCCRFTSRVLIYSLCPFPHYHSLTLTFNSFVFFFFFFFSGALNVLEISIVIAHFFIISYAMELVNGF